MKIGIDVDGVLANFTDAYAKLLTEETGIIYPKFSKDWPTEWFWDKDVPKDVKGRVWKVIRDTEFNLQLEPMAGAVETLRRLNLWRVQDDHIYFITSRPGERAKWLTERWLSLYRMYNPTVLIVDNDAAKGLLAKGLKLDVFIDDKPENCAEVVNATRIAKWPPAFEYPCKVFLVDGAYNRHFSMAGVTRVANAQAALAAVETSNDVRVAA